MNKSIGLALVVLLLICSSSAFAGTCVCIGKSNLVSACGNGGMAGSPYTVKKDISDALVKSSYLVKSAETLAEYDSAGKAYSLATGWLCFK